MILTDLQLNSFNNLLVKSSQLEWIQIFSHNYYGFYNSDPNYKETIKLVTRMKQRCKSLDIFRKLRYSSDIMNRILGKHGDNLISFNFEIYPEIEFDVLDLVCSECPNLKELIFITSNGNKTK